MSAVLYKEDDHENPLLQKIKKKILSRNYPEQELNHS